MPESRLDLLRNLLAAENCSHILITGTIDVEYISGFHSSNASLLVSRKSNLLFSDFRYKEAATVFCQKNTHWKFRIVKEGNFAFLSKFIPVGSIVGIQANELTLDHFHELKRNVKGVKFLRLSTQISDISIVKLPQEISAMREAASIGDVSFNKLLKYIKPGITEQQLAHTLDKICIEMGSEKAAFDSIVLFGARSALPHGRPSGRKLKNGDWVLLDYGCTVHGFFSDITRTVVCGKASKRQRHVYETVRAAQEKARDGAKPGITAAQLDSLARTPIEKAGFGVAFGHATGHGVGLRVHEKPRISSKVQTTLQKGMVFTIEPGIYFSRFGGVRIEDMIVLTAGGAQLLTNAPRNLIEVSI